MSLGTTLTTQTNAGRGELFDPFRPSSQHAALPGLRQDHLVEPFRNYPANVPQWPDYRKTLPIRSAQPWVNDPIGPVWDECNQIWRAWMLSNRYYNAGGTEGVWSEFVSNDLITWTFNRFPFDQRGIEYQAMWGGSVVEDKKGTAGFGPGAVLYFVSGFGDPNPYNAAEPLQRVVLWVAPEFGMAPVYYGVVKHNPVIENGPDKDVVPLSGLDFRDSRVFYDKTHQQWVMMLTVGYGIVFYKSADLLNWEYLSVWKADAKWRQVECPNLVQMTDNFGTTKWVLFVSMHFLKVNGVADPTQDKPSAGYMVGEWDGTSFTSETGDDPIPINYGHDYYAQSIAQKDGYTYCWAWACRWEYSYALPSQYRGCQSLTTQLSLLRNGSQGWFMQVGFVENERISQKQIYSRQFSIDNPQIIPDNDFWVPTRAQMMWPVTPGTNWRADLIIDRTTKGWPAKIILDFCYGKNLTSGEEKYTRLTLTPGSGQITLNRSNTGVGLITQIYDDSGNDIASQLWNILRDAYTASNPWRYDISIIFDGSVAEIIVNGLYFTSLLFPPDYAFGFRCQTLGGDCQITSFTLYY